MAARGTGTVGGAAGWAGGVDVAVQGVGGVVVALRGVGNEARCLGRMGTRTRLKEGVENGGWGGANGIYKKNPKKETEYSTIMT